MCKTKAHLTRAWRRNIILAACRLDGLERLATGNVHLQGLYIALARNVSVCATSL